MPRPRSLSRRRWCFLGLGCLGAMATPTSCRKAGSPFSLKTHDEQAKAIILQHAELVSLAYRDCQVSSKSLSELINGFVQQPTPQGYVNARQSWIQTRIPYTQGEAYLFQEPENAPFLATIDTWPIQPSFIDGVQANSQSGIVNQLTQYPNISDLVLSMAHREPIRRRASLGFHVIEFLLWGEDASANTGPRARSSYDFLNAPNADRRGQMLKLVTARLAQDFTSAQHQWESSSRDAFLQLPVPEALGKIFGGITSLTSTGLHEKLTIPLESGSSRDEVSQFSDNTQNDLKNNLIGLRNVFQGRYELNERNRLSGSTSLKSLLEKASPDVAQEIENSLRTLETSVASMPGPFDELIPKTNEIGRAWIQRLLDESLRLGKSMREAGNALGVSTDTKTA